MTKIKNNFYFFGFGNMAQAIYQRMNKRAYDNIFIIEKSKKRVNEINNIYDNFNNAYCNNSKIINNLSDSKITYFDTILLAVKPGDIKLVCSQLKPLIEEEPLIISIAAGIGTLKIKEYLGNNSYYKLARAMPNLCAKKGMAITGLFGDPNFYGKNGGKMLGKDVSKIFSKIGKVLWVKEESDLDSVTAISGSGPAYIYYIMNVMIDTAEELGLERNAAQKLVAQTIIGAGETGKDINNLTNEIVKVSSKGGTTEKAIDVFKQKKLDAVIKQAIKSAHKRSKELSKQ